MYGVDRVEWLRAAIDDDQWLMSDLFIVVLIYQVIIIFMGVWL